MDMCTMVVCIFLVAYSARVILPRIIGAHASFFPHNNVFMMNEVRSGSFICMRSWRGSIVWIAAKRYMIQHVYEKIEKLCMLPDRQK